MVIELAMKYSVHMERACFFSFGSPPVSSKALPQNYFFDRYHKLSCLHKFLLCIMCAKCAATPCNLHWLRPEAGGNGPPSLTSRCGGGGGERVPGTHCLRMHVITMEFRGDCVHTCMYVY